MIINKDMENLNSINILVINNQIKSTLDSVRNFGIFLNKSLSVIKMTHWFTQNYDAHKIIGNVYDNLSDLFDKLEEEIIGTSSQQGKPFPEISYDLDWENIQNYKPVDNINMESYYKASQTICSVLNSQEFTAYTQSVVSGINNTKEEIISELNKASYLLNMINLN